MVADSSPQYTARAVAGLVTDIGIIRPRDMQDFPELYCTYQNHKDSHVFRKSKEWREWVEGKRLFNPKTSNLQSENSFVQWEKRPHYAAPESTRWVEAVGVFDTVGSLGIPEVEGWVNKLKVWAVGNVISVEKPGFHNVSLSPCKWSIPSNSSLSNSHVNYASALYRTAMAYSVSKIKHGSKFTTSTYSQEAKRTCFTNVDF